jgi:hypothetical protein
MARLSSMNVCRIKQRLELLTQLGPGCAARTIWRNLLRMDLVYVLKHNLKGVEESLPKLGGGPLHPCEDDLCVRLGPQTRELDCDSRREVATSLRFWQLGFRGCHLLEERGLIAYLQWLFLPSDAARLQEHFPTRYLPLGGSEAMIENAFTFPSFRGRGFHPHATVELLRLAKSQGCRAVVTYIRKDKISSLNNCMSVGFRIVQLLRERKFLGYAWIAG